MSCAPGWETEAQLGERLGLTAMRVRSVVSLLGLRGGSNHATLNGEHAFSPAAVALVEREFLSRGIKPGDLDRVRFACAESRLGTLADISSRAGLPPTRTRQVLAELVARGEVCRADGHRHGDDPFCRCTAGELRGMPRVIDWKLVES